MAEPVVRAREAGGQVWDDPSEKTLYKALAYMNLRYPFLIVERLDLEPAGQHYMQVYLNDDMSYQVEYREGGEDKHFEAHVPAQPEVIGVEPVAKVLADWAFDRPGWRDALPWEPWP
ncbi:hypothetical protein AB0880_23130 [Micromonospora chersina]|uniref:hypothetical protein n=1 Tax=Micromonospora chersina TaxID=47854 RepID=UPI0034536E02